MTPAEGKPRSHDASFGAGVSRVSHHAAAPPARLPATVAASQPRVLLSVTFSKSSGLAAAAPRSAPPPRPTSTRRTRDCETDTRLARVPAPTTPMPAPYPMPVYGSMLVVLPR